MGINLNRVTITGHLVSDPTLQGLSSGKGSGVAIDGRLTSQPPDCEDAGHPGRLIVLTEEMQL